MTTLFEWRDAICSKDGPDPITRLVLLVISNHMDLDGTGAWPSQETIAKKAGISLSSVKRHLASAADGGWISRRLDSRKQGHGWRKTLYAARVPDVIEDEQRVVTAMTSRLDEASAPTCVQTHLTCVQTHLTCVQTDPTCGHSCELLPLPYTSPSDFINSNVRDSGREEEVPAALRGEPSSIRDTPTPTLPGPNPTPLLTLRAPNNHCCDTASLSVSTNFTRNLHGH